MVSRLGLPDAPDADVLRERNHQRFLSGETKPPEVVERVLNAIASVLAGHGYVETAGWPEDLGFPTPEMLLGWALRDLRARWDSACVRVRGGLLRGADLGPVMLTAAHLVVIDLAVRGGAWLVLIGHPGVPRHKLLPGKPTAEVVMNFAIKESGRTAPELAAKLGIERTAIDAWRKGARPSDANLGVVSTLLAEGKPDWAAAAWWSLLRRYLTLAEIMKDLEIVPWFKGEVDDLWQSFWEIASGVALGIRTWGEDFEEEVWPRLLTGLVMWGSGYPASIPLLHNLRAETPPAWQSDLVAGHGWADRLLLAAGLGKSLAEVELPDNLPESVRELASDPQIREAVARHILGGPTPELSPPGRYDGWECVVIKNPPPIAAENRRMQAGVARSHGRFDEAIAHLRRAVELVPTHDSAHFELGAALWESGDIEGGLAECRIAAAVKPEWDLPQVEIGIIFLNAARYEEARAHLETVYAAAKTPSTHLKFNLATARWRCGAFAEGLALLEEVLSDEGYTSYPYALDQAAHCAFMVGDDVRGRAHAKRAHDLGCSVTYRRWAAGGYRKAAKTA
jgi:tetratricopeptide (TPR) repeat protein